MSILYNEESKTFHLTNGNISYIMKILPNHQVGQMYFGKRVRQRTDYDCLLEPSYRPMSSYIYEGDMSFSLEHVKQEYPSYGTGDFRHPAITVCQKNGSRITDFQYKSHQITSGKPCLEGLPAVYCESDSEAETLHIFLEDDVSGVMLELLYTIFEEMPVLAKSVKIVNQGSESVWLEDAMSICLDLPDADYEWMQFSGAWARERHPKIRKLEQGIQSVESTRGNSSHNHNPFVVIKRPDTNENQGEAIGVSLIYSGNFLAQAEVDTWNTTRIMMGINRFGFSWKLETGETFQTPEAIVTYSDRGLNYMSQTFHHLYQRRLARGFWRDRPRPILINNWEATTFDISEEKILKIAETAKKQGIELFVLDDGWFGERSNDKTGLGDWNIVRDCLPNGIIGLAEKVVNLGMQFGLWIEPEMVNRNSHLFQAHPEWALQVEGRRMTHGRNQFVLDFGRREVVDYLYQCLSEILRTANISYIKWDMNRSITEAFSASLPPDRQGEVCHRYILGVYDLYERLTDEFPEVLFESCASGGGRFDPGMLYYAPQGWLSDDTDAIERMKIQYGSSYCYPISSFGTHVSAVPNQQTFRKTSIWTRANVAFFGTFGYELDLNLLPEEELEQVRKQVEFMKKYREVFQFGDFYRLLSPFDYHEAASWMVVSEDKKTAIVGWYKMLNEVNGAFHRVKLCGLDGEKEYKVICSEAIFASDREEDILKSNSMAGRTFGGDELMNIGLITTDSAAGECRGGMKGSCDFDSRLYILKACE